MDRQSHAEVGGPYSNQDDAERAITRGNFSGNKADLIIQEGEADDGEGTSKEAARKHTAMPGQVSTQAPIGGQPPIPPLGQPMPDMAPQVPQTTKPSTVPGGGGPSPVSPGGEMPQDFSSQQFQNPDTFAQDTPGDDAVSTAIASVAARVRMSNPEVDEPTARRVARQVVGKLVEAGAQLHMVHIEDPLANKTPLDVVRGIPQKKKPQQQPQNSEDSDGDGQRDPGPRLPADNDPFGDGPPGEPNTDPFGDNTPAPRGRHRAPDVHGAGGVAPETPLGAAPGAAAAGEGAAALGEGAELLPLLML